MRKALITMAIALIGTALLVAPATARQSQEQGTIVEVAAGNSQFSTLVSLVEAAGLVDALSGTDELTVFAPTNGAFNVLEKRVPGITAALTDPANKKLLQDVLKYHVLAGEVKSPAALEAAQAGASVATLLGDNANGKITLKYPVDKIRVADSANFNLAVVVAPDVEASNGVIHVVNKVFVPSSVAAALQKAGLIG